MMDYKYIYDLPIEEKRKLLKEKGFEYNFDLGYYIPGRLVFCLKEGYIKNVDGRFFITTKGNQYTTFKYLWGDVGKLYFINNFKKEETKSNVEEMFSNM